MSGAAARVASVPAGPAATRGRPFESARVHAWLRQSILEVSLLPGAALAESEIATRFGTSRTPVREALLRLVDEGLIDIRPQRGTYVARISLARLDEALFVRVAVEGAVLRHLAASPARRELARSLDDLVDAHEAAVKRRDLSAMLDSDAQFHRMLVDAIGMPGLWDVVARARDQHHRLRALAAPHQPNGRIAVEDHRAILRALRSGNGELAQARLAAHLDRNRALAHSIAALHPAYFE